MVDEPEGYQHCRPHVVRNHGYQVVSVLAAASFESQAVRA